MDPEHINIPQGGPLQLDVGCLQGTSQTSTVNLPEEHQEALKQFENVLQYDPQLDQRRTGRFGAAAHKPTLTAPRVFFLVFPLIVDRCL